MVSTNKRMDISRLAKLFVVCLFLSSCIDEKDYSLDSLDLNPSISLPLTYGSVSIVDFLSTEDLSYVKTDKDGLLSLEYSTELISRDIRDLFLIPDLDESLTINLAGGIFPSVPQDVVLGSTSAILNFNLSPEQLSEINFKSGQFLISTSTIPSIDLNYDIIASFPDFTSKATNSKLVIEGKGPTTIQLADYIVALDKNKFTANISFVLKATSSPVTIPANTRVVSRLSLNGMEFNYIKGFAGEKSVSLQEGTLAISTFENSLNNINASLAQPSISIRLRNDYGMPVTISYDFLEARKTGANSIPLVLNPTSPLSINFPTVLGESATTNLAVVNINDIVNYAPTQIYYKASAIINKNILSGNNFLADTSKVRATLDVKIPLYGRASGITLSDTAAIDLSSIEQSQIIEASLKIKISNQIPMDGTIQFYLTDSNYRILDELLTKDQVSIIKGSVVDSSGDLKTAGVFDQSIVLDKTKLTNLFSAKHIIITSVLSTSKDATGSLVDVKFRSQYKMTIETGISAKLNLNVKI